MVEFVVPGDPVPQPRPRVSTRGGFARAYVPSTHAVHPYRQSIALHARAAGLRQTTEPLEVDIVAVFARPQSHRTKAGIKSDAPALPRADVDNVAKAVLDALREWFDDSSVRRLTIEKFYADVGYTSVWIVNA